MKSIVTFSDGTEDYPFNLPPPPQEEKQLTMDFEDRTPENEAEQVKGASTKMTHTTRTGFFLGLFQDDEKLTRAEHRFCRLLIHNMTETELRILQDSVPMDWCCEHLVEERLESMRSPKVPPPVVHNKSWQTYFRYMKQRTKGRVPEAREKLRKAFDILSWAAQKEVLRLFLTNGLKVDRLWALEKIRREWSLIGDCKGEEREEWERILLGLWEKYADRDCGLVIVKHFAYDVVSLHEKKLTETVGYKDVVLRLGENPEYPVEKTKLLYWDWLYVMTKLGRKVTKEEAEQLLWQAVSEAVFLGHGAEWEEEIPSSYYARTPEDPSLLHDDKVGLIVWCMAYLGFLDEIIDFYYADNSLKTDALKVEDVDERWRWIRQNLPHYFPYVISPLTSDIMDAMQRTNPYLSEFAKTIYNDVTDDDEH